MKQLFYYGRINIVFVLIEAIENIHFKNFKLQFYA